VTDALVLSPRVDGVILVIDPNKTKRAAVPMPSSKLRQVKANLIGIVLNNIRVKRLNITIINVVITTGKNTAGVQTMLIC